MVHTGPVRTGDAVGVGVGVVAIGLLVLGAALAWSSAAEPRTGSPPLYAAPDPPATGAGSATVLLSADAGTHPAAPGVHAQLQRYFNAINARDHAAWAATVAPERAAEQPQDVWLAAVDTTVDGTIRIDRIDDLDGGRVLVLVRFVSVQDLSDAPAAVPAPRICWRASLPMSGNPPLLESGDPANALAAAC
jgi:hypothetical protein